MAPAVTVMVTLSETARPWGSVTVSWKTRLALFTSWVGALKLAAAVLALVRGTVGEPEDRLQA